jgi:hypothetical protein
MTKVEKLASDFRRWGKDKTRLVHAGVKKWGVIFDFWWNSSRTKG